MGVAASGGGQVCKTLRCGSSPCTPTKNVFVAELAMHQTFNLGSELNNGGSNPSGYTKWECANVGELGLAVTQLPFGSGGSNPSTPT